MQVGFLGHRPFTLVRRPCPTGSVVPACSAAYRVVRLHKCLQVSSREKNHATLETDAAGGRDAQAGNLELACGSMAVQGLRLRSLAREARYTNHVARIR